MIKGTQTRSGGASPAPFTRRVAVVLLGVSLIAAACGGDDEPDDPEAPAAIRFITLDGQPDRMAKLRGLLDDFEATADVTVELIPADETTLAQIMTTNAASGTLPDLVAHPATITEQWVREGLLLTEPATEVMEALDMSTFHADAIDGMSIDGKPAAVPTHGLAYITFYRSDLFEDAGLEPPDTFENVLAAARALHDPASDRYGISLQNDPGEPQTHNRFEYYALANGCQLVADSGEVSLTSPECIEVFEFADELQNYAPEGTYNSTESRAFTLSGQAAMRMDTGSNLHRLAGLEDEQAPTCGECADDLGYLAERTGMLTTLAGPSGSPASWGLLRGIGITADADVGSAKAVLEYLMSEGYAQFLSQLPNDMLPARHSSPDEPDRYVNQWRQLEVGVDRKALLDDIYGPDLVDKLLEGTPKKLDTWSLDDPALAGAVTTALVIPRILAEMQEGRLTPQEAAEAAQAEVVELQASIGD